MSTIAEDIVRLVRASRFAMTNEKQTQAEIQLALSSSGYIFLRESRLSKRDIPDFYLPLCGLAIEVKLKSAGKMQVFRQLQRYAEHEKVREMMLVTNLAMGLPPEINGKPTYYVSLGEGWL